MIWGHWEEPTRRVKAIDPDGSTRRDWITAAPNDSDDALRERLERAGYSQIEIAAYDFGDWKAQAKEAAEHVLSAIRGNEKPAFKSTVWGALKQHLFDLSEGRCAYCEAKVQHVDYGDVEHYRPKSSVKEDASHRGYYWLAYEPSNFLPSCGLCNKAPGKLDQFPVVDGTRAIDPASRLEDERPLLVNPFADDPRKHLMFLASGDVHGKTEQGKRTIVICRLQRLREERRAHMEQLAKDLNVRRAKNDWDFEAAVQSLLHDLLRGRDEYCNALLDHLLHLIEEEQERVKRARERALSDLGPGG